VAPAPQFEVTEAHQEVIDWARAEYEKTGSTPNIRKLTSGMGISTKELYTLFPQAPARTIAVMADIPKPAGCI
jgi:tRNA 2-thiouridine synthesizing protein E